MFMKNGKNIYFKLSNFYDVTLTFYSFSNLLPFSGVRPWPDGCHNFSSLDRQMDKSDHISGPLQGHLEKDMAIAPVLHRCVFFLFTTMKCFYNLLLPISQKLESMIVLN